MSRCAALVVSLALAGCGEIGEDRVVASSFHYKIEEGDWEETSQGLLYTVDINDSDKSLLPPGMQDRMSWERFIGHFDEFDEIDMIWYTDGYFKEDVEGRGSLSLQFPTERYLTISRGRSRTDMKFDPDGMTYYGFPGSSDNLLDTTLGDDMYFPDFQLLVLLEDAEEGPIGSFSVTFTGVVKRR